MRWIGSSDAYKGREWRRLFAKENFAATFADIEQRAAEVRASDARPSRKETRIESLRNEYRAAVRRKRFVEIM